MLSSDTLENYEKAHQIEWASELPDGCPPEQILVPDEDIFYRLTIDEDRITTEDLKSHLELYPNKNYLGFNRITASGVSVLDAMPDETKRNLPRLRRFKGVAKLTLSATDGVLMKSGPDEHHYTWWPTTYFDISVSAEIVKDENT